MSEVVIWKLVDMGFMLLQMGLERDNIIANVRKREEAGDTPDQIVTYLKKMRDEAAKSARQQIAEAERQAEHEERLRAQAWDDALN